MTLSTMILKMSEGLGNTCAIFFLTLLFSLPLGMIFALLRVAGKQEQGRVLCNALYHLRSARHAPDAPASGWSPTARTICFRTRAWPEISSFPWSSLLPLTTPPTSRRSTAAASSPCPWGSTRPPGSWATPRFQTFTTYHLAAGGEAHPAVSITNEVVTLVKDTSLAFCASAYDGAVHHRQGRSPTSQTSFMTASSSRPACSTSCSTGMVAVVMEPHREERMDYYH